MERKKSSFLLPLLPIYLFAFFYNATRFPGWCENGDGILFYPPGLAGYFLTGHFYLVVIMYSPLILLIFSSLIRQSRTKESLKDSLEKLDSIREKNNLFLFLATLLIWLGVNIGIAYALTTISLSHRERHWTKSADGSWTGSGYCISSTGVQGCPCMD